MSYCIKKGAESAVFLSMLEDLEARPPDRSDGLDPNFGLYTELNELTKFTKPYTALDNSTPRRADRISW